MLFRWLRLLFAFRGLGKENIDKKLEDLRLQKASQRVRHNSKRKLGVKLMSLINTTGWCIKGGKGNNFKTIKEKNTHTPQIKVHLSRSLSKELREREIERDVLLVSTSSEQNVLDQSVL